MFTGNLDIDEQILLSLDLQDVENFCSTNKYLNQIFKNSQSLQLQLKNAKSLANKIMIKNRKTTILMCEIENMSFLPLYKILDYLDISEYNNRDWNLYMNDYISDLTILNSVHLYVNNIPHYLCYSETLDGNEVSFLINQTTLIQLLTHMFYNNLIFLL